MAGILDRRKAPAAVPTEGGDEASPARVIVASARRIDLADKKATIRALGKRQQWQDDAWLVFHAIGEVGYADRFLAHAVSRLRLYPAVQLELDQPPVGLRDAVGREGSWVTPQLADAAEDALRRIRAERGGQAAILQAITLGLEVAGECFLLGYEERDAIVDPDTREVLAAATAERWEVRSTSEVRVQNDGTVQTKDRPEGGDWEDVPAGTFFLRIWEPDPQWQALPDSALRNVLSECDELLILSRGIRASGRSRMHAGLLLVPTELSFGPIDRTQQRAEGDDDPFTEALTLSMANAVEDEGDPSALVPPVVRGKAEHLNSVRHLTLARSIDEIHAGQRSELLKRIAQGLNVPPEIVTGMADLNHWTAWQVDDSTFSAHVEPRALSILDALTTGAFRPILARYDGVKPEDVERVILWYDESEVVTQPNRAQDAKDAHARNVISDKALRDALNFSDDDAPTPEELARRVGMARGILDGALSETLIAYLLGPQFVDAVEKLRGTQVAIEAQATDTTQAPAEPEPADAPPAAEPAEGAAPAGDMRPTPEPVAAAAARPNAGARLARIDSDLFTRVRVAADAAMARTLERAGARLRSRAQRDGSARQAVASVENADVAATLGPAVVATLATDDELLEGAFDGLRPQWDAWVSAAQEQALQVLASEYGAVPDRVAAERRMQADADEAWRWFQTALVGLARDRLYGRVGVTAAVRTTATLIGEADPALSMPAATVREALARAGGGSGLEVQATGAGGVRIRTQAGLIPAGGVATGQVVLDLAADQGAVVEWYTWRHGSPPRPFPPHAELDGVRFYGDDDPNVSNGGSWPPDPYFFPGDHAGCTCQAEPYLRSTADLIG